MKRLGIKGGYATSEEVPDPNQIAPDGRVMVRLGNLVEEWSTEGLEGVHLVWDSQHNQMGELIEMMSVDSCLYEKLSPSERRYMNERWVPGQSRMLVVTCPKASLSKFWSVLEKAKQLDDGACRLHYTSRIDRTLLSSQFGKMFSGLFGSVTVHPNGTTLTLPNGGELPPSEAWERPGVADWVELVGFKLEDVTLSGPMGVRNRRALSVASAFWASRHWHDTVSRLERPEDDPEWALKVAELGATPEVLDELPATRLALRRKGGASPVPVNGDMIACNSCTLFNQCRLARAGAICTLPESDMGELAEFFKTRDANRVIEGLGLLLGKQADRVEQAMAEEMIAEDSAELRSDVTKMINGLFDRGVKLAQLNDPRLKGGPQVQVSLTQNAVGQITQGSPQQLAAGMVAELESRGVRREDITPELIEATFASDDVEEAILIASDPVTGVLPEQR
jgi:hypothetical protein